MTVRSASSQIIHCENENVLDWYSPFMSSRAEIQLLNKRKLPRKHLRFSSSFMMTRQFRTIWHSDLVLQLRRQ